MLVRKSINFNGREIPKTGVVVKSSDNSYLVRFYHHCLMTKKMVMYFGWWEKLACQRLSK